MSNNKFWIENPAILVEKDLLMNFTPSSTMSLVQKMNAITRFCLYGLLIGFIFNFNDNIMYILFVSIIVTIIIYKINQTNNTSDNLSNNPDLFNSNQIDRLSNELSDVLVKNNTNILENFNKCNSGNNSDNNEPSKCDNSNDNNGNNEPSNGTNETSNGNNKPSKCNNKPSKCNNGNNEPSNDNNGNNNNGNGNGNGSENNNNDGNNKNLSDNIKVKLELSNEKKVLNNNISSNESTCKFPTKNNPLMNINIGDNPLNNAACEYSDEIKENINKKFKYNLYQDVDDLFGRYNSQRQFYTMPSTSNPNDQKSFAEWLYKSPETCKENSLCLRYEDTRYNK
jgi:hypothetical protein